MQSQNKTKTLTQNNIRRSGRRRSQNPQTQQAMRASSGSCRVHRKELWFEINSTGTGRYVFEHGNYPLWFEKLSQVFESYEMHSIRIHWISGYSQFAGGSIFMSYNVNEAQKDAQFTVSSLFAQQNSGKSRLAENSSFSIPSSSWRRTPNRRMCSGAGSYLFDLRYAISTTVPASPITVWIEYDVTFHTPQIEATLPTPVTDPGLVFSGEYSQFFGKPYPITSPSNEVVWAVEGSFTGFVAIAAYYTTTPSTDKEGYTATITYEDSTTANIAVSLPSGSHTWNYTFTGITGHIGSATANSPSQTLDPIQFYETNKKISKIEVTLTSSSVSRIVIAPY